MPISFAPNSSDPVSPLAVTSAHWRFQPEEPRDYGAHDARTQLESCAHRQGCVLQWFFLLLHELANKP